MPRKSRASKEIVPIEQHLPRIETPPGLSQEERELFERIVKQCGPTHFTNSDLPLLVAYVSKHHPCRYVLPSRTGQP